MIEKPNIPDEQIIVSIQREYGLSVAQLASIAANTPWRPGRLDWRQPMKRRWLASSSAMGKLARNFSIGQVSVTDRFTRSMTATCLASGTLTKMRWPCVSHPARPARGPHDWPHFLSRRFTSRPRGVGKPLTGEQDRLR